MLQNVLVGAWGGNGGYNPWKFTLEENWRLSKIQVVSNNTCVYSIRFTYVDADKVEHHSPVFGGDNDDGKKETVRNHS